MTRLTAEIVYTDSNGGPYVVPDTDLPAEVPVDVLRTTVTRERDGSLLLSIEVAQGDLNP